MGNNLTVNPMIVTDESASPLLTGNLYIAGFRWVSKSATAGDQCIVKDGGGIVKFESVAAGVNHVDSEAFPAPLVLSGLLVSDLDSGTLYITRWFFDAP